MAGTDITCTTAWIKGKGITVLLFDKVKAKELDKSSFKFRETRLLEKRVYNKQGFPAYRDKRDLPAIIIIKRLLPINPISLSLQSALDTAISLQANPFSSRARDLANLDFPSNIDFEAFLNNRVIKIDRVPAVGEAAIGKETSKGKIINLSNQASKESVTAIGKDLTKKRPC